MFLCKKEKGIIYVSRRFRPYESSYPTHDLKLAEVELVILT